MTRILCGDGFKKERACYKKENGYYILKEKNIIRIKKFFSCIFFHVMVRAISTFCKYFNLKIK